MLSLTFDSSVKIDAERVLQNLKIETMVREVCARVLVLGHKKKYWTVTFNLGESPKKQPEVNTSRGPWLLGVSGFSELGVSTILANSDKAELFEKVGNFFATPSKDYALLADHINAGRDWFIAQDKHFLRIASRLISDGIVILQSSEAVQRIANEKIISRIQYKELLANALSLYNDDLLSDSK